jgi:hypothetical protein
MRCKHKPIAAVKFFPVITLTPRFNMAGSQMGNVHYARDAAFSLVEQDIGAELSLAATRFYECFPESGAYVRTPFDLELGRFR